MFLRFLPFSSTPYAQTGKAPETTEEVEVNPSASLNEWLVPGFPSSQELEVTNISILFPVLDFLF
jgi:hypothetical protein